MSDLFYLEDGYASDGDEELVLVFEENSNEDYIDDVHIHVTDLKGEEWLDVSDFEYERQDLRVKGRSSYSFAQEHHRESSESGITAGEQTLNQHHQELLREHFPSLPSSPPRHAYSLPWFDVNLITISVVALFLLVVLMILIMKCRGMVSEDPDGHGMERHRRRRRHRSNKAKYIDESTRSPSMESGNVVDGITVFLPLESTLILLGSVAQRLSKSCNRASTNGNSFAPSSAMEDGIEGELVTTEELLLLCRSLFSHVCLDVNHFERICSDVNVQQLLVLHANVRGDEEGDRANATNTTAAEEGTELESVHHCMELICGFLQYKQQFLRPYKNRIHHELHGSKQYNPSGRSGYTAILNMSSSSTGTTSSQVEGMGVDSTTHIEDKLARFEEEYEWAHIKADCLFLKDTLSKLLFVNERQYLKQIQRGLQRAMELQEMGEMEDCLLLAEEVEEDQRFRGRSRRPHEMSSQDMSNASFLDPTALLSAATARTAMEATKSAATACLRELQAMQQKEDDLIVSQEMKQFSHDQQEMLNTYHALSSVMSPIGAAVTQSMGPMTISRIEHNSSSSDLHVLVPEGEGGEVNFSEEQEEEERGGSSAFAESNSGGDCSAPVVVHAVLSGDSNATTSNCNEVSAQEASRSSVDISHISHASSTSAVHGDSADELSGPSSPLLSPANLVSTSIDSRARTAAAGGIRCGAGSSASVKGPGRGGERNPEDQQQGATAPHIPAGSSRHIPESTHIRNTGAYPASIATAAAASATTPVSVDNGVGTTANTSSIISRFDQRVGAADSSSAFINAQWAMEGIRMRRNAEHRIQSRRQVLAQRREERRERSRRRAREDVAEYNRERHRNLQFLETLREQRESRLATEVSAFQTREIALLEELQQAQERQERTDYNVFLGAYLLACVLHLLVRSGYNPFENDIYTFYAWLVLNTTRGCQYLSCQDFGYASTPSIFTTTTTTAATTITTANTATSVTAIARSTGYQAIALAESGYQYGFKLVSRYAASYLLLPAAKIMLPPAVNAILPILLLETEEGEEEQNLTIRINSADRVGRVGGDTRTTTSSIDNIIGEKKESAPSSATTRSEEVEGKRPQRRQRSRILNPAVAATSQQYCSGSTAANQFPSAMQILTDLWHMGVCATHVLLRCAPGYLLSRFFNFVGLSSIASKMWVVTLLAFGGVLMRLCLSPFRGLLLLAGVHVLVFLLYCSRASPLGFHFLRCWLEPTRYGSALSNTPVNARIRVNTDANSKTNTNSTPVSRHCTATSSSPLLRWIIRIGGDKSSHFDGFYDIRSFVLHCIYPCVIIVTAVYFC